MPTAPSPTFAGQQQLCARFYCPVILLLLTAAGCPFVTACEAVKVAGDKVLNSNTMAGGAGGRQYMTLRKKAEKKKDILA